VRIGGAGGTEGSGPVSGSVDAPGRVEVALLEVPALPAYVGVARAVVRAVAAMESRLDEDRLDDIRLAVSEVCTDAVARLDEAPEAAWVTLRCVRHPGRFEVCVETPPPGSAAGPPAPFERRWSAELVRALVDEVDDGEAGGFHVVRLAVRLGG
jgi:anti-sigma regulatory factor (Ser/Thr protein kinase)